MTASTAGWPRRGWPGHLSRTAESSHEHCCSARVDRAAPRWFGEEGESVAAIAHAASIFTGAWATTML